MRKRGGGGGGNENTHKGHFLYSCTEWTLLIGTVIGSDGVFNGRRTGLHLPLYLLGCFLPE